MNSQLFFAPCRRACIEDEIRSLIVFLLFVSFKTDTSSVTYCSPPTGILVQDFGFQYYEKNNVGSSFFLLYRFFVVSRS